MPTYTYLLMSFIYVIALGVGETFWPNSIEIWLGIFSPLTELFVSYNPLIGGRLREMEEYGFADRVQFMSHIYFSSFIFGFILSIIYFIVLYLKSDLPEQLLKKSRVPHLIGAAFLAAGIVLFFYVYFNVYEEVDPEKMTMAERPFAGHTSNLLVIIEYYFKLMLVLSFFISIYVFVYWVYYYFKTWFVGNSVK